ncbi:transglycosylase SLT domain-containing protein [bacterium]|nr:transglycosylase SLT domain-containing protein [bacterium]
MKVIIIYIITITLLAVTLASDVSASSKYQRVREKLNHFLEIKTKDNIEKLISHGEYKKVIDDINSFSKKQLSLFASGKLNFVLGYANYKLKMHEEARGFLKSSLNNYQILGDYSLYYLALMDFEEGKYEAAVEAFLELCNDYSNSMWVPYAREKLAESRKALGDYDRARANYEMIKKKHPNFKEKEELDFIIGELYFLEGKYSDSYQLLSRLYLDGIEKTKREQILGYISEIDKKLKTKHAVHLESVDMQLKLATGLNKKGKYGEEVKILKEVYKKPLSVRTNEKIEYNLARAYFKLRDYNEAQKRFEKIYSKSSHFYRWNALDCLIQVAVRQDRYEDVEKLTKKLLENKPKSGLVQEAVYRLGFVYMDSGKYKEAIEEFKGILKSSRGSQYKSISYWNLAWCYYQTEQYDSAVKMLKRIEARSRGNGFDKMRAVYWQARSHERLGDFAKAQEIYRILIEDYPRTYYSYIALQRMDSEDKNKKKALDYWYVDESSLSPSKYTELDTMDGWKKIQEINGIGLHEELKAELMKFYRKKGVFSYLDLLKFLDVALDVEDYHLIQKASRDHFETVMAVAMKDSEVRRVFWEAAYPRAYNEHVESESIRTGVNPNLIYAIMREESTFKPKVLSSANAIGLMQIIPPTGRRLAKKTGLINFKKDSLEDPIINIRLGTYYLKELLMMFGRQPVYAIASYNAGETAVARWINNGYSDQIEEFIEEIPYQETRNYVKKVLASYWIYQELYGAREVLAQH